MDGPGDLYFFSRRYCHIYECVVVGCNMHDVKTSPDCVFLLKDTSIPSEIIAAQEDVSCIPASPQPQHIFSGWSCGVPLEVSEPECFRPEKKWACVVCQGRCSRSKVHVRLDLLSGNNSVSLWLKKKSLPPKPELRSVNVSILLLSSKLFCSDLQRNIQEWNPSPHLFCHTHKQTNTSTNKHKLHGCHSQSVNEMICSD